jgi:hypothetical protein
MVAVTDTVVTAFGRITIRTGRTSWIMAREYTTAAVAITVIMVIMGTTDIMGTMATTGTAAFTSPSAFKSYQRSSRSGSFSELPIASFGETRPTWWVAVEPNLVTIETSWRRVAIGATLPPFPISLS